MLLAISIAIGGDTEFEFRGSDLGPTANMAAVQRFNGRSGLGKLLAPVGSDPLAAPGSQPLGTEKDEEIREGYHYPYPVTPARADESHGEDRRIEYRQPFDSQRDDEEHVNLKRGVVPGESEHQRIVEQKTARAVSKDEPGNCRSKSPESVVNVQAKHAHGLLQAVPKPDQEKQIEGGPEPARKQPPEKRDKQVGNKTPNLPLQDRGGVQFQSLDECRLKLAEHKNQPV